jgi:type II secretory pathway pseudopilin PulG
MTITTSPPNQQAQNQSNKGSTLFEMLIVFILMGILGAIIAPNVFKKELKADLVESKTTVLNLLKLAQSSAIIEHSPFNIKQKVRFLIHIDPRYKEQYCACMMLIQGARGQWNVLQPPMQLPANIFFVPGTEHALQTMDFDPVNIADGQGPAWLYYEFDSKGRYTGTLNRVCLNEGKLEEEDGTVRIAYKKHQDSACIYINPTGFAHDVQK